MKWGTEQKKPSDIKAKKYRKGLRDIEDTVRSSYLFHWISTKRENEQEVLFKEVTMAVNFLNLRKNINIHIREGLQPPSRIKTRNLHPDISQYKCRRLKTHCTVYCFPNRSPVSLYFAYTITHSFFFMCPNVTYYLLNLSDIPSLLTSNQIYN